MTIRSVAALLLVAGIECAAAQTQSGIERAAWLEGCWESAAPGRTVEESWLPAKGGSMIGVGRTIRDGKTTSYEMVVLREHGERLEYEAHPSGQSPATFLSTRITASELVFENPEHDFPQEVGYRLDGATLVAWIRGVQDGKDRRIEFPYARAQCGSR